MGMGDRGEGFTMMSYEKLDVYQCSINFLETTTRVLEALPRGRNEIHDQLKRASISIPLNIAEGAGKRTKSDCNRYFTSARGSAMECGAILDVCFKLGLVEAKQLADGKKLLERIVAMLTKMTR